MSVFIIGTASIFRLWCFPVKDAHRTASVLLEEGAVDYILKPFNPIKWKLHFTAEVSINLTKRRKRICYSTSISEITGLSSTIWAKLGGMFVAVSLFQKAAKFIDGIRKRYNISSPLRTNRCSGSRLYWDAAYIINVTCPVLYHSYHPKHCVPEHRKSYLSKHQQYTSWHFRRKQYSTHEIISQGHAKKVN